jgi:Uncharacterized protein conserved in bacteria
MPNDILYDLQANGHLARTTRLAELGHGRRAVERATAKGRIHRICADWVGTPTASRSAVIAVLNRAKLTGSTALASYGVWDGLDRQIHLHVPRNSHGPVRTSRTSIASFAPERFPREGVRRHWLEERYPDPTGFPWRVSAVDALIRVAHDVSAEQFIACVESALHVGVLSRAGLGPLFAALPRRYRRLLRLIEPLAESGLETLARLRLARFVEDIRVQVWIDGIGPDGRRGRVDLLLDGWLVIELDGDEFHDPVRDRHRNSALVRRGYRIHRFGYDEVIHGWADVEATVRELLHYRSTS